MGARGKNGFDQELAPVVPVVALFALWRFTSLFQSLISKSHCTSIMCHVTTLSGCQAGDHIWTLYDDFQ